MKKVVYPPVGIAHITKDVAHLIKNRVSGKSTIVIRSTAQPNSYPHIGTVTTIMTTFALAKHFSSYFSLPTEVRFEELENSPGEKKLVGGLLYTKSLKDIKEGGISLSEKYMKSFRELFDFLSQKSCVKYRTRNFEKFQADPRVRKNLLAIINQRDEFTPALSPSEDQLRIRFPCPICQFVDKRAVTTKWLKVTNDSVILSQVCFDHGEHILEITPTNHLYVDTNAPITDVLQGALFIEEDKRDGSLSIMVDGNDWSGVWVLNVFCEGLSLLGYKYNEMPLHFYAPLIEDWSGAKFSKTVHVETDTYSYLPEGLVNLSEFLKTFGWEGLNVLWEEALEWAQNPEKLFRNYSIDYILEILKRKGGTSRVHSVKR